MPAKYRPLRWKVVKLKDKKRISCYAGGKYQKEYEKDTTVEAAPDSQGILVFNTEIHAKSFREEYLPRSGKTVRVLGVGRGKKVTHVCIKQSESYIDYWNNLVRHSFNWPSFRSQSMLAPEGTMAYKSVIVLD